MEIISRYLSISYGYVLDMEIRLKLREIGNSLLITIPSQVVDDLKLMDGDDMLLDVKDATIVIRKKNR
jgi:antitoxin component of MazEF toxin-antitoxin module